MNTLRAYFRLIRFVGTTTGHVLWAAWIALTRKGEQRGDQILRVVAHWSRSCERHLGIEIIEEGDPPPPGTLLMPNHRSYMDVVPLVQRVRAIFVAKIQVKSWPLIGLGADLASTVWVDREDKDSRRKTRELLRSRLASGKTAVVFPEGTTYMAPTLGELRPGMFFTAAGGGFPITPVGIEYEHPEDAWTGKDTFVPHFVRCFAKPVTRVKVRYGPQLEGDDGEALRTQVRAWLEQALPEMRQNWVKNRAKTEQRTPRV